MGWFDYLWGPPGKDRFADSVIAELRRQQAILDQASPAAAATPGDLEYDPERFCIRRADGGFMNLANVYHEFCNAPRAKRQGVLQQFIRSCVGTVNYELPEEFDDIHPDLLPVVRSRFYLESVALQAHHRGPNTANVPQLVIGDHLSLSLVYDLPQAMRTIGHEDLENWGVTFYEALEAAQRNLEQMGKIAFAQIGEGLFASATGDNYDASRLVLLELVRRFPLRGTPIAMVPNRDTLLLTGEDDEQGLEMLAKIAADSLNQPRPISTIAVRLEGDQWRSWLPEPTSRAFTAFHELRLRTLGAEYSNQKELLDQEPAATPATAYVAQFNAVQKQPAGRITSYTVWPDGLDILLPETDEILLFRSSSPDGEGELVAGGRWEHVRQVVGSLMQPQGMYPERYLVQDFPSEQQLRQIGKPET